MARSLGTRHLFRVNAEIYACTHVQPTLHRICMKDSQQRLPWRYLILDHKYTCTQICTYMFVRQTYH